MTLQCPCRDGGCRTPRLGYPLPCPSWTRQEGMGPVQHKEKNSNRKMPPSHDLPGAAGGQHLEPIARGRHRQENPCHENPRSPPTPGFWVPVFSDNMLARDEAQSEKESGSGQDMSREEKRLPGMVHDRERVGALQQVLHPGIGESCSAGHEHRGYQEDSLEAADHLLPIANRCSASIRRQAEVTASAVREAPERLRIPRRIARSALRPFPANCPSQASLGK